MLSLDDSKDRIMTSDPVAALETTAIDKLSSAALDAAEAAARDRLEAARATIVPEAISPISPEVLREYGERISRLGPAGYESALAELHRRSLFGHPVLSECFRTLEACEDVHAAAAGRATLLSQGESYAEAGERAGRLAVSGYLAEIAGQLVAAGHELGPAAKAYLDAHDQIARLAVLRLRMAEAERARAAQLEIERQAAERAADEAVAAAEAERELKIELRRKGLPENLSKCELVESEKARLLTKARVRVRLLRTKATGVRLSGCLYCPRDLAGGLDSWAIPVLNDIDAAITRAEQAVAGGYLP
jgi:hypothetical protein